ncbi:aminoglycoside phosphotransferase family protein [Microlunatus sp. Gsoil 973]|uniref:aminoglycoside phosphotransferase family protein n=1 Tax=Microlunatus sp. Gsoil 973 TaxID=2672569 RepID=UPI0018A86A41|nr:aminoglycoside phosphotransferase family protein [Microlunatus sp. Gsoil 973]
MAEHDRGSAPVRLLGLSHPRPLAGGVASPSVVRADWSGRDVVVKRTSPAELAVLRLFADLDEPMLPRLLASGVDGGGPWIVIPFHDGRAVDLMGEPPAEVHHRMGRLHARFHGRTDRLADALEVIDPAFVRRGLAEFGTEQLRRARDVIGESLYARGCRLLAALADDEAFCAAADGFDRTLLHGDLYGLNVLQPSGREPLPLIIDWGAARIGPAMFDVAMTTGYDSAGRRAHDRGWAEISGAEPDPEENELAHAWSTALISAMFAGTVAARSSAADGEQLIIAAEDSVQRFRRLHAVRQTSAPCVSGS